MLQVVLALALSQAGAQRVAVLKIVPQGAALDVAETLTQVVAEQVGHTPGYSALSQSELTALLGVERQKQLLGCGDQACLAEIGGALGARLVLSGTLGKVGSSFVLQLQLIDTKAAQIRARESRTINGVGNGPQSELLEAARDLVSRVLTGKALDTKGKIKFAITPIGARVVIDGVLVGRAPLDAPVVLEQGTHRVHIEADGYVPFDAAVDAVATQTLFNAVDLVSTAPLVQGSRNGTLSAIGWALIGVAAAAGGGGIAFGALAQGDYSTYQAAQYRQGGPGIEAGALTDKSNTQTLSTAANFCYLGAGVVGLVGVGLEVWALLSAPSQRSSVEVHP